MSHPVTFALGVALILLVLRDTFETIILPRTVIRLVRLIRSINAALWPIWRRAAAMFSAPARRERLLAFYGPTSVLLMIVVWACSLIVGFALISHGVGALWALPSGVHDGFRNDLYVSGTTLFTLGLGDVTPITAFGRVLVVIEAGTGLGFLAVGVAYLPVLYQSFSRREVQITLLDAWAGSPPSAMELLRRLSDAGDLHAIQQFLKDWERWCAEVLEGHISYPQVAYFRSQHGRQSWVSALTCVLDVSSLVMSGIEGVPAWQAHATFAIARHTAVDLCQILIAPPRESARQTRERCAGLLAALEQSGIRFDRSDDAVARLEQHRSMYEPYVAGLARAMAMDLPPWARQPGAKDNWEASPRVEKHL